VLPRSTCPRRDRSLHRGQFLGTRESDGADRAAERVEDSAAAATDPDLDRIRDDPGVVAFMKELKAQWEQYRAALREPPASAP
jgi:hypothetical protein